MSDFMNRMEVKARKIEKQDIVIHVMTDNHRKWVRAPTDKQRDGEKEENPDKR
jgi:hypothetical protein